ncbi:MAG TPA: transposase [Candidatus Obscuribacterales bacterium]
MSITLNYCYRIYPNATQEQTFLEWLEICRSTYNYALREIKDWANSRKCSLDYCSLEREYIIPADTPFPDYYKQQNALPKAKKEYPKLSEVPSQVLQTTVRRLHDAWDFFLKRGYGFPRFKKYGQFKSILFPQVKVNCLTGWQITLPKVGSISINLHRPIPAGFAIKQVRVVKRAASWEAVITIESDASIPEPQPHGHAIGIDLGLEKFLATSDREFIDRPRFFVEKQSRLKVLQRRLSRKKKRSKNYEKARIKVAKQHNHIANTRKLFHYKTAHHLCDQAGMIFVEDIDFRIMGKGFLGKHTLDAGFGAFRNILRQVCFKGSVYFATVDRKGTSQTCPKCGAHTGKKDLSERVHKCSECGYETHRDHASAEVIRLRGLEQLVARDSGESKEPVAVGLPGFGKSQARSETKPSSRKGGRRTRNVNP